jgi:hypothetical protein
MFRGFLRNRETAMIFKAGDIEELTQAIVDVTSSVDLYARLSGASSALLQSLLGSALWGEVLSRWLMSSPEDVAWLKIQAERTLASIRAHSAI